METEEVLAEYPSIHSASRTVKRNREGIRKACLGVQITCVGYM